MGISCSRYSASDLKQHRIKDRVIKSNHRLYSLEISGKNVSLIADKLELSDPQKSENISLILRSLKKKSKFDNIPYASKFIFSELTKAHIGGGWYMDKNGKKFRLGIKYKDGCKIRYSKNLVNLSLGKNQIISLGIYKKLERIGSPFANFLKEVIDNNVTFLKIKKITKVMPQNTYDLQVEDDHEFIANGMVVHNCLGKYHPHGDTAVYDAMVRMAQSFSLRYPLVDGQGNFGSIDGDNPAAMRYTESRLSRIAEEMLQDIEKETVDFTPNFDNCLKEPVVLPSKLPNLLINGSSGIAVGMATTIPPHNLSETVDALLQLIDNSDSTVADLMEFIKGPDFPTAGIIQGTAGIKEAYSRGKGKITVRARTEIEETKTKTRIIVKEIPYMVNKAQLVESVADLIRDKIIQGISDIRDESDKKGMRVVFDLKSDSNSDVVLNQLFKHTRLESTFGVIMLALVDNVPRILTLKQMLSEFVEHRRVVVRRRTVYDLTKAEEKAHILEGLVIALSQLDLTIRLIKQSKSVQDAKISLVSSLKITEIQAAAILDMKLQRLTSLEQDKIREERKALLVLIEELKSILASDQKILDIIKKELVELKERYGDGRKTKIVEQESEDFEAEDLIKDEKVVVTVSHAGYIKRQPLDVYKVQARGGKGVIGAGTKEEDFVEKIFVASTHSYLLVFTSKGIVHGIKVHMVPDGSRTSKGKPIVNLIEIPNDEKVTAYVPVKHFDEKHFLFLATRDGTVKKTPLTEFEKLRKGGIRAITLEDDDQLISAKLTTGDREIIVATRNGLAVRFNEQDVRPIGRAGKGVRGINLKDKDSAIGMEIVKQGASLITVTENGYGKQTPLEEYRAIGRGGVGVINIQCTERNGTVVSIKVVSQDDEIMIMSQNGIVIRTPANGISNIGRNTQGVKLMKLEEGDKVIEMAKVISGDEKQLEKEIQAEENA
jgi:DNA gyrase subunit A